jgi:hypothetical protein
VVEARIKVKAPAGAQAESEVQVQAAVEDPVVVEIEGQTGVEVDSQEPEFQGLAG